MIKVSLKELDLTDMLTLLFIISVGYGLILKVSFFTSIGLPWVVSVLTPTLIFYTTIKVFFQLIIGVVLGIYLAKYFNGIKNINYIFVLLLILIITGIPAYTIVADKSIFLIRYINWLINFHFIFYCSYQSYLIENDRILYMHYNNQDTRDLKSWFNNSPKFITFIFLVLLVFSPAYFGKIEASKVTKHAEFFNNQVVLTGDKSKWYLIEYLGDKVIIKSDDKEKLVYKIVEVKEIDKIISNYSFR